jgi:hypothetical protein
MGSRTVDRPRPSFWRRVERWMVGLVMAVIAIVLERMVLRSIKKKGDRPEAEGRAVRSRGGDVDLDEAR